MKFKNILLFLSLAANATLAVTILKDRDETDKLQDELKDVGSKVSNKLQQVKGSVTGNKSDELKGNAKEGKRKVTNKAKDLKNKTKENK